MTALAHLLAAARCDRRDAEMLAAHVLGVTRAHIIAHGERVLAPEEAGALVRLLARRAAGEPYAYLTGTREFYGRAFRVTPATLIPRPETEILVEQALARLAGRKWPGGRVSAGVLDLGTGSGAIAVTLALESGARVTATDRSAEALAVARANAAALGASIELLEGDWYAPLAGRRFDLIVSNPPYVAQGDPHLPALAHEPLAALTDESADGLASLRAIAAGAPAHLQAGGHLLVEHGFDQDGAVREILLKAGFDNLTCQRDLAGIPRVSGGQFR